jgi:hypothetical protein
MHVHVPAEAHRPPVAAPDDLTTPDDGECVLCFASAMGRRFGCDGTLRWVRRWRDLRRPGATGLERLMESGGGYCDCEVFLNGWDLLPELMVRDLAGDLDWPPVMPPCAGIGPRSSRPCALWEPRRRR